METKPPHSPTPEQRSQVEALYSFGIPQEDIAAFIGIDAKTLRKHYRDELDKSIVKANAAVGQFLYNNATGKSLKDGASHADCVRAAMFWAKTRMGWKEGIEIDHTTKGQAITRAAQELTDDELASIASE